MVFSSSHQEEKYIHSCFPHVYPENKMLQSIGPECPQAAKHLLTLLIIRPRKSAIFFASLIDCIYMSPSDLPRENRTSWNEVNEEMFARYILRIFGPQLSINPESLMKSRWCQYLRLQLSLHMVDGLCLPWASYTSAAALWLAGKIDQFNDSHDHISDQVILCKMV